MPFIFGNDFDELPPNMTTDDVTKCIVAALSEQLVKLVNEALRPHLYALTGNVDYAPETPPEQPRRKR